MLSPKEELNELENECLTATESPFGRNRYGELPQDKHGEWFYFDTHTKSFSLLF